MPEISSGAARTRRPFRETGTGRDACRRLGTERSETAAADSSCGR
ncbi:hypothetical protein [Nesterenkonia halobia]